MGDGHVRTDQCGASWWKVPLPLRAGFPWEAPMTPDLTPEGLRALAWQVMHEADSCDHSSCGVPHDNADRECEAQRIAAAFTALVAEARAGLYVMRPTSCACGGSQAWLR